VTSWRPCAGGRRESRRRSPRSSRRGADVLRRFAAPFSTSVGGPFQYRKGSALPDYELDKVFVKTVTSKVGAAWIGVSDHVMRRAGFTRKFTVPTADRGALGGISGGPIIGRLDMTEVGRPQRINAPKTVAPFADLALAIDGLGDARR
jgi:hypothetical protein